MPLVAPTLRVLSRFPQRCPTADLLGSVLRHHGIAVGPAARVHSTTVDVGGTAVPPCSASAAWCTGAHEADEHSSQEVRVRVIRCVAATPAADEGDATAAQAQPYAAASEQAESEGCDAAGAAASGSGTSTGAPYFTLAAVQACPRISFCEILWQWERFVECGHADAAAQTASRLSSAESALLNLKLEDCFLSSVAALRGVRPALDELPPHIANVVSSDLWADGGSSSPDRWAADAAGGEDTAGARTPRGPTCYTLAHFSAELGDVAYVQALQSAYPAGMPLRWFAQPVSRCGGLAAYTVQDDDASQAPPRQWQQETHAASAYPLAWIAEHCPDHTGRYLCHLAACHGHAAYLDYLVSLLGAEAVLAEQQCALPATTLNTWGRERYMRGLTAVQCAMAFHQLPVLVWVEEHYAYALESMNAQAVLRALTAAAIAKSDQTDTFDFLLTRSLPPLDILHASPAARRAAGLICPSATGPHARGVQIPELQEGGLLRVIFAAAEVGNINVLAWFHAALDPVDMRQVCDSHGATVLHHCARGGHAATMAALLQTSTAASAAGAAVHTAAPPSWSPLDPAWIDLADKAGRTPAMWCVLGGHQGGRGVAMLEALRTAGSNWPRSSFNGVTLFDVAVTRHSRHTKLVKYLKSHMRAA